MRINFDGNGAGKYEITMTDMGGWVRIQAHGANMAYPEVGAYLSHALTQWFRNHVEFQLVTTVPIVRQGNTVELHGWYVQRLFNDISPLKDMVR